jgi:hypothetical protein
VLLVCPAGTAAVFGASVAAAASTALPAAA